MSEFDIHFPEILNTDWSKQTVGERTRLEIIEYIKNNNKLSPPYDSYERGHFDFKTDEDVIKFQIWLKIIESEVITKESLINFIEDIKGMRETVLREGGKIIVDDFIRKSDVQSLLQKILGETK